MTNIDLLRHLMLMLEARQTSPRQNVVIELYDEAEDFSCTAGDMATGLARLLAIDYIDGPGLDQQGFFLFRKLTRRGSQFVRQARNPRDWERIKRQYVVGG